MTRPHNLSSEELRNVHLFSTMDDQELDALRAILHTNQFLPGQVIIREGEPGDRFHIIISGTVEYVSADAEDNELILDDEGPGSYFGELSMLTGEPRTLRVRARDEVKTLSMERHHFHDFLLKHPHAGIDVLTVLGKRLYRTDAMLRKSISRNVNEVFESNLSIGARISDGFAAIMGSWPFIIVQSALLITWVGLNINAWVEQWDPYPFILLNLALSFQAAYAAPIIMMSQNRAADKDRLAAEIDHEVNVKAEVKIGHVISRLDDIEREMHLLNADLEKRLEQLLESKFKR